MGPVICVSLAKATTVIKAMTAKCCSLCRKKEVVERKIRVQHVWQLCSCLYTLPMKTKKLLNL